MLRHEYVSGNDKAEALANVFELAFEDRVCVGSGQKRLSSVTTEGDEVKDATFLVPDETLGHDR